MGIKFETRGRGDIRGEIISALRFGGGEFWGNYFGIAVRGMRVGEIISALRFGGGEFGE